MKKILVIDDESLVRNSIKEILELTGEFRVLVAENGRRGVELARRQLPDLIICDIEMPLLDGYGVLEELRADTASPTAAIPFIFLTARADRDSTRRGMESGADDYLVKPFRLRELLAAVNARLQRQAAIHTQYERKMETLRDSILLAVPHEFRTPLSSIVGYGEVLAVDAADLSRNQISTMANNIVKAGKRLHRLIENYLIYAQIELIMTDPERVARMRAVREAQPDTIVRDVAEALTAENEREIHLHLSARNAVLPMSGDNLRKIVEELLDNAFKFSPEASAVEVATTVTGDTFTLGVRDKGRGMTPEQIRNVGLFMQFERRIYEQQGSGTGLMIVKRLADLYGGRLDIDSEPDAYTRVRVRLPA